MPDAGAASPAPPFSRAVSNMVFVLLGMVSWRHEAPVPGSYAW